MKYYRVIDLTDRFEHLTLFVERSNHSLKAVRKLQSFELFTEREYSKIMNCGVFFDEVTINKNNTYKINGIRFEK